MEKLQTVAVDESDFGEIEHEASSRILQDCRRQVPELVDPSAADLAFEPQDHRAVNACRLKDPQHTPCEGNEGAGRRIRRSRIRIYRRLNRL